MPLSDRKFNIVEINPPTQEKKSSFSLPQLKDQKSVKYSEVFSQTEKKESRFRVSELTRKPLSIEAEENEKIELQVQQQLQERLKQIEAEVREKAHQEGFRAGQDAAKIQMQESFKPLMDEFRKSIGSFDSIKYDLFKANEEFFAYLILRICRMILLKELATDSEYIQRLCVQLLEKIQTKENIKIFISPSAISAAERLKSGLAESFGELKNITIEQDSKLAEHDCRIETDFVNIESKLDEQIAAVAKGLGAESHGGPLD